MTNPFAQQAAQTQANPFAQQAQAPAQAQPQFQQPQAQPAQGFEGAPQPQTIQQPQGFGAPQAGAPAGNLSEMFGAPVGGGDFPKFTEDVNRLVCVEMLHFEENFTTNYGSSPAWRIRWFCADEPNDGSEPRGDVGEIREDGLVFSKVLVGMMNTQHRRGVKYVVGRLSRGTAKQAGHSAPYILVDVSPDERAHVIQMAQQIGFVS